MEKKISKTKIEKRMRKKTNPELVETIIKLKKTNPTVAKFLAMPVRKMASINLKEINSAEGDVLVVGKVLASGDLDKPKKIIAWSASKRAIEKIKEARGSFGLIVDEMKKNPELKNLNLIK